MEKLNDEGRTTSLGLLNFSNNYFQAYEIIRKEGSIKWPSPVMVYMFCHGVELLFKAFLRNKGKTVNELKGIGHDLENIIKACGAFNCNKLDVFTKINWGVVSLLNQQYKNKEFEYSLTGFKQLPSESDVNATLENMVKFKESIYQNCANANKKEREQ